MKAYEIFRLLSTDEVDELVLAACDDEQVPDKLAGGVLTYQRMPLRRFEKLPDETRRSFVRRTLRDRRAADLSLYVLSAGITRRHRELISRFLDGTGLPHDGPSLSFEGEIPAPETPALHTAIDAVLAEFPARDVAVYLHAFAAQPDAHWAALEERLASDERLRVEDRSAA